MNIRLFILVVFTLLTACGGSGSSSSGGANDKENLIVVLGDSIGFGYAASIAFPDVIAGLTGIPVINISVPGTAAETGVGRAQGVIDVYNPRYIVALLGTNNAKGSAGGVSGAIYAMQVLAQICRDNGVICIIGTLPPISRSVEENNNVNSINGGYHAIPDVRIADNNPLMTGADLTSDGVHPNNSGQQKIGEIFSAQLP